MELGRVNLMALENNGKENISNCGNVMEYRPIMEIIAILDIIVPYI